MRKIDTTISQIQLQLGETPDVSGTDAYENGGTESGLRPAYTPRPDEFFQMSQGDAAKAFLEKTGRAVSLDDLVSGLRSGGCKVGGADPKRTLYISLVRNVRDFVPVGDGFIGLRKFYPNTARPGRPAKAATSKPKKKAKSTKRTIPKPLHKTRKNVPQPSAKEASAQTPPPDVTSAAPKPAIKQSNADVKRALHEVLSDSVDRTVDELLSELKNRLTHPVKRIAVYGLLRGKDFEAEGEKFRNRQNNQQVA